MMSTGKAIGLSLLAAFGLAVVGVGIWALTVGFSGIGGAGGVHKDQNNAKNREHWSAVYNGDYNSLQADKSNIAALTAVRNAPGSTEQDQMNLVGAVMNCAQDVATYNADAQNVLGRQWIPSGLPTGVNIADYCPSN
jgi:hypothetical protein